MTTPHIAAEAGAFAPVVLMPGDPQRAQFIAEEYLDDVVQVTDVRNILGFTGTADGQPLSVLAHGIGIPSMLIYTTELARFFGCHTLIRVGSCGSLDDELALGDLIVATGAGTDSAVNRNRVPGIDLPAVADFGLVRAAVDGAAALDVPVRVGTVFSSDLFYGPDDGLLDRVAAHGMVAVEMETAGLYAMAAAEGVRALALLTVSDRIGHDERLTADERATGFDAMMRLALEAVSRL